MIHERDYILRRTDIDGVHIPLVTNQGKLPQRRIEQVGCNVADLPRRRDSLEVPFARRKRTQQVNQLFIHPAEQMSAEDGRGTGVPGPGQVCTGWGGGTAGLAIHAIKLTHGANQAAALLRESLGSLFATNSFVPGFAKTLPLIDADER